MSIKKFTAEIVKIIDVSETAKEVHLKLSEPLDFWPGNFINVFFDINGEMIRRAYSISSSCQVHDIVTLTIRLSPKGTVTPTFWAKDMLGQKVELMGPLGLNTVDKMKHQKIYLFAFGVGVGVVKSIADYFANIKTVEHLTIMTGSRSENEMIYKDYFNNLALKSPSISVNHVVSNINMGSTIPKGYIQDFIGDLDFNHSDVYVCGQEVACSDLIKKVEAANPIDCSHFIEAFH